MNDLKLNKINNIKINCNEKGQLRQNFVLKDILAVPSASIGKKTKSKRINNYINGEEIFKILTDSD